MDAFLTILQKIQAYGDKATTSNPRLRMVDWSRDVKDVVVQNVQTETFAITPGATQLVFNGVRSTTVASDTAFAVALSSIDSSRYRFTWTGGTNPTLRTDRGLTLINRTLTFAVLANNTVSVTVSGAGSGDFTSVVAGDTVFIPNVTTGDASNVISVLNSGTWQVIGATSSVLTLARPFNVDFEGISEVDVLTSSAQFQVFSAAGVQVGDMVDISGGFSLSTRNSYEVVAVTSKFFEVVSTLPLPAESGILPGVSGIIWYSNAKVFLYVEADQLCAVQLNGATDTTQRIKPVEAGNPDKPGNYHKFGPAWSLSVVNMTTSVCNLIVVHAE